MQIDEKMRDLHLVQWKARPGIKGTGALYLGCSCLGFWHVRMCSHTMLILDITGAYQTRGGGSMVDSWATKAPLFRRGRKTKQGAALSRQTTPSKPTNANAIRRSPRHAGVFECA